VRKIEAIINDKLPYSSKHYTAWWANKQEGNHVHKTDAKFFENESNWSVLKAQMLVGALRKHQLEQTNNILSFLEQKP